MMWVPGTFQARSCDTPPPGANKSPSSSRSVSEDEHSSTNDAPFVPYSMRSRKRRVRHSSRRRWLATRRPRPAATASPRAVTTGAALERQADRDSDSSDHPAVTREPASESRTFGTLTPIQADSQCRHWRHPSDPGVPCRIGSDDRDRRAPGLPRAPWCGRSFSSCSWCELVCVHLRATSHPLTSSRSAQH